MFAGLIDRPSTTLAAATGVARARFTAAMTTMPIL